MNETELPPETPAPIAPPLKGVAKKIAEARDRHAQEIDLLLRMADIIDKLPDAIADKCHVYMGQLDIDTLTREESLQVIGALHAGKWSKTVNSSMTEKMDYETTINGVKVRLWAAGPPDSCRIVEVEEVIPATKIVHRRLVCTEAAV